MNKIVLDSIDIQGPLVKYRFHTSIELNTFFNSKELFIQYEDDVSCIPLSILSIPFVNLLSGFSWLSDSMLFVDELDKTYYESHKVIKVAYSELHRTRMGGILVPSKIIQNSFSSPNENAILLFGGGVDCHSSFIRNREKVTEIVNIYGWLNDKDADDKVDTSDKEMTAAFAERMGVKASHFRSNFASLFNLKQIDKQLSIPILNTSFWYGLLHPMAFLSISAPLAWLRQIPHIIIASSFTKDRADVHCGSFITTDSEFRFADQGDTLHDGFELNRQDKVHLLVDYQKESQQPYIIQACSFNDHNCCVCEKCFRTFVELVAENADPRDFGFVDLTGSFIEHWKRIIERDIAQWGVSKESYYYYYARCRMLENYSCFDNEKKGFVDWFLSFDFEGSKRLGMRRYYRKNFISILRRKLGIA